MKLPFEEMRFRAAVDKPWPNGIHGACSATSPDLSGWRTYWIVRKNKLDGANKSGGRRASLRLLFHLSSPQGFFIPADGTFAAHIQQDSLAMETILNSTAF